MLVKNCTPYPQILPIHGALWNSNVKLKIENPSADNWSFRVEESTEELKADEMVIPAITVDELMKMAEKTQIDILKIDIESGEKDLLEGDYCLSLTGQGACDRTT